MDPSAVGDVFRFLLAPAALIHLVVIRFIAQAALILIVIHWVVPKIRRKPKVSFSEWLKSWIAGPELIFLSYI
jgi:hypothetical protein